ncbi:hypothetical protein [Streptomyces sp. NPDC055681]
MASGTALSIVSRKRQDSPRSPERWPGAEFTEPAGDVGVARRPDVARTWPKCRLADPSEDAPVVAPHVLLDETPVAQPGARYAAMAGTGH